MCPFKAAAMRTFERLKLFALAESLGAVESLARASLTQTNASTPLSNANAPAWAMDSSACRSGSKTQRT